MEFPWWKIQRVNQHNAYKDDFSITISGEPLLMTEDEIQSILKKFPFHGRAKDRQVTVLSSYLMEAPGNNKADTAEKLEVDRNTVRKIEESWSSLTRAEKLKLMDYLRRKYAERHFSDLDSVSVDPGADGQTA
jgi:hypothetical protein